MVHDLRRSFVSLAANLGVPHHLTKRLLQQHKIHRMLHHLMEIRLGPMGQISLEPADSLLLEDQTLAHGLQAMVQNR
jgi:hypothetical protein